MTDDLNDATEARERARRLLAKAAGRRAAAPETPAPQTAAPLERIGGLHDLLRDLAAYLGDRPNRDHDAMGLYARVMRMLGEGGE